MVGEKTQKFDIVHHTGLFYHLINPVMSLQQCRSVIRTGGKLLVETACTYSDELTMRFSHHGKDEIYHDETTWWAPSIPCLRAILDTCGFRVDESSVNYIGNKSETSKDNCFGRVALVATSVDPSEMNQDVLRELRHHYRTPGLML